VRRSRDVAMQAARVPPQVSATSHPTKYHGNKRSYGLPKILLHGWWPTSRIGHLRGVVASRVGNRAGQICHRWQISPPVVLSLTATRKRNIGALLRVDGPSEHIREIRSSLAWRCALSREKKLPRSAKKGYAAASTWAIL
jgi:hypothetical protein